MDHTKADPIDFLQKGIDDAVELNAPLSVPINLLLAKIKHQLWKEGRHLHLNSNKIRDVYNTENRNN